MKWFIRIVVSFVILVFVLVAGVAVALKIEERQPPDFALIVSLSGLPFKETPQAMHWTRRCSGFACNDLYLTAEFELKYENASMATRCDAQGYMKGIKAFPYTYGLNKMPSELSLVCWKQFGHPYEEGRHFFAIYDGMLIYVYDLM